jgi:mono/diheme cytochrome c family protein
MSKYLFALVVTVIIGGIAAFFVSAHAPLPTSAADASDPVARGDYLVHSTGCADCHTPWKLGPKGPEQDMSRWLSGHPESAVLPPAPALPAGPWITTVAASMTAWAGPWGTSFTANLTPDAETGLGAWTFEQFRDALRTGRHQGRGRQILPPMPWPAIRNFTDEDLRAVFAYLRSIPAIKNHVPQPIPPAG